MDNKETVQKGLDARKNVKAAEAEAERARNEAAEANQELISEQINRTVAQNNWERERSDLLNLLAAQCELNHELRCRNAALIRSERERRQRVALTSAAKTLAGVVLLIVCRDLGLVNVWLANSLLGLAAGYIIYSAIVMVKKYKD